MAKITKSINFGEIDHLLYIRITSLCADLGYATKDFILEGCCSFFGIVDEKGVSDLKKTYDAYKRFQEDSQKSKIIPRMNKKHALVVNGIEEEVVDYLNCVKKENNLQWVWLLGILLMLVETDRDKMDKQALAKWAERENEMFIIGELSNNKVAYEEGSYQIYKTRLRREYEEKAGIYPRSSEFDFYDE